MSDSAGIWLFVRVPVICQLQRAEEFKAGQQRLLSLWGQSCPENQLTVNILDCDLNIFRSIGVLTGSLVWKVVNKITSPCSLVMQNKTS